MDLVQCAFEGAQVSTEALVCWPGSRFSGQSPRAWLRVFVVMNRSEIYFGKCAAFGRVWLKYTEGGGC